MIITKEILKKISPTADPKIIADLEKYFDIYLPEYNINTWLRISHFLAQCAHESAGFRTLEEYASGAAYEGRKDLGNNTPGDGRRYKGRGIIQLTGRANYRTFGKKIGKDLENKPILAMDPEISVLTACEYWNSRDLSKYADKDDILTITKRINGGTNGLKDRQDKLQKAKSAIPKNINLSSVSDIAAKRGVKSPYVSEIQEMLFDKGIEVHIDGDFGPATEKAVKDFQTKNDLEPTGYVNQETLAKLLEK